MQEAKIAVPTASSLNALSLLLHLGDNFRQLEKTSFQLRSLDTQRQGAKYFYDFHQQKLRSFE